MSLKPKEVDFVSTWTALEETVRNVVTLQPVPRPIWNDRFRYCQVEVFLNGVNFV